MRLRQPAFRERPLVLARDEFRAGDITRLEVVLRSGRIEVGGRSRPDVRVRVTLGTGRVTSRLQRLLGRPPRGPVREVRDGVLFIDAGRLRARLQLELPAGVALRARITSGELTLWGAGGDLDLTTGAGTLAGRELSGASVRARSSSGEVNLHFAAAPTTVDAHSERGAVRMVLPAGTYAVDASSAVRPAEVTVDVDDGSARQVRAISEGGPVSVLRAEPPQPI